MTHGWFYRCPCGIEILPGWAMNTDETIEVLREAVLKHHQDHEWENSHLGRWPLGYMPLWRRQRDNA